MKTIICCCLLFCSICTSTIAQGIFHLSPGTQLLVNNNTRIVLNNTSFQNNGSTGIATTARMIFTGNSPVVTISGSSNTVLSELELNKSFGNLQLARPVSILSSIIFNGGNLDLNGHTLFLVADPNGQLVNENSNSRIIGNTGIVRKPATLNAPINANPGNMGVFITAAENLGEATIERRHYSVNNQSIQRIFHITAANNAGLNAILRFQYLDAETGGLDKNLLTAWKSNTGNSGWVNQGGTADAAQNTVTLANVNELGWFTLAQSNAALPLVLASFSATCRGSNEVWLQWQTSMEQNTSYFEIQKSVNGASWVAMGTQNAAGNSSSLLQYNYSTNGGGQRVHYRLRMVDKDGQYSYSPVQIISCNARNWNITAFPNPVIDKIELIINGVNRQTIPVGIYNSMGLQVWRHQVSLNSQNRKLTIPAAQLPAGVYFIKAGEGQYRTSITITKQ